MSPPLRRDLPNLDLGKEGLIYHYTTAANFINIANSKELWLTHFKKQKDQTELNMAFDLLEALFKAAAWKNARIKTAIEMMVFNTLKRPEDAYISCFCADFKNQYLWDNYAEAGKGVVLALDAYEIASAYTGYNSDPPYPVKEILFYPVNYGFNLVNFDKEVRKIRGMDTIEKIKQTLVIKTAPDLKKIENFEYNKEIIVALWIKALLAKNAKFTAEKEWRIIHYPKPQGPNTPLPILENKAILDLAKISNSPIKRVFYKSNCQLSRLQLAEYCADIQLVN
jgi:hypothetical protein